MLYNDGMDKFAALADPTRRQIIEILAREGELPAAEISRHFKISPQAISQHLKTLRGRPGAGGKTSPAAHLHDQPGGDV